MSGKPAYQTEIDKCDVPAERREALAAFREKRLLWLSWLQDDEHAVSPTISSLVWNDVSFRTLAKAGEIESNGCLSNSLIAETLISGHFALQTLGIRRLVDKRNDVVSLSRVLRDVRENIHLLIRENFVCFDGVPYDSEAARKKAQVKLAQSGFQWGAKTGPEAYWPSEVGHAAFDTLSGVPADRRTRTDQIPVAFIEALEKELNDCEAGDIVSWTHKYLAHAADPKSRSLVNTAAIQPTLNKITNVTKVFVKVSEALQSLFLSGHGEVVPVAQFNPFEALEAPAIEKSKLPELRNEWETLSQERNDFLK